MVGWLVGRLSGWLVVWQVGCMVGWFLRFKFIAVTEVNAGDKSAVLSNVFLRVSHKIHSKHSQLLAKSRMSR